MTQLETLVGDELNAKRRAKFPHVWLDDTTAGKGSEYLVKGLLDRASLGLVYGPAGSGKTFFAIDMACHIASGLPWRGRRVGHGLVVYVATEAGRSIEKRFAAWRDRHLGEAREERTPLAILTRGVNLLEEPDVEALVGQVREIAAETKLHVALVVFDTLSRSIPGANENSAEDMTQAIAAADRIRDVFQATVLFVHHSGKDPTKGARGHSALFAAADSVIAVAESVATIEKSRDGAAGEAVGFSLDIVEMGVDADGDPVTTCVIVPTEATAVSRRARPLSGAGQTALRALQEAIRENGERMAGSSTIPVGVPAAQITRWRERFRILYGSDGDAKDSTLRMAFLRGKEALLKAGTISISDPYVWVVE